MADCLVTIRGLPNIPSVTEVNIRTGPGTNFENPFKAAVGMSGLAILDIQPDAESKNLNGKVYQWFKVQFPGGEGWVRDDLIEIEGDCARWGYSTYSEKQFAYALARSAAVVTTTEAAASTPTTSQPPTTPAVSSFVGSAEQEATRVRKASFAITAAFEGGNYKAYNNYDAGIVSYGLFQFTLAASSLQKVLERYLAAAQSDTANKLRGYMGAVQAKDAGLRHDMNFKALLLAAGDEPAMQEAQIQIGTENYWNAVYNGYITPRGLKLPLSWALLFDMGINFGTGHGFVRQAEKELGVAPRSRPGENGISEEQLTRRVAELRKKSHDTQAVRDNLPGLRVRGDFWMALVNNGDWGLQGDSSGNTSVNGRLIQVRNP